MNISSQSKHLLAHWLPMVTVYTLVVLFMYVAVQQVYRSGADQPQTDMARVLVEQLTNGAKAPELVGTDTIDLRVDPRPFITIVDQDGVVVASNAVLDGKHRVPPIGAIRAAELRQNTITWQPEKTVRMATVIRPSTATHQYVIVGRSLFETERRITLFGFLTQLALIVGLIASLAVGIVLTKIDTQQ